MIGAEFVGVLHAAQQGRVAAFERLWTDVHPALIRYLRVVAVADADDIACESWVAVVRRLRTFDGDETAWRFLVFSAARMHAEDENQRRVWDAMVEDDQLAAVVAEPLPAGEEPFDADELEDGSAHGLRLAIEAIRDLPPEQGDVLMLRRMAELPVEEVATLVGAGVTAVHGLEQQALDQLGLDAELLHWALAAEARPVELADEATIVEVFRAVVPEQQPAPSVMDGASGSGGARVIAFRPPTWRARAGAVAAASAAVVGMGAISAAAYQGVLPDPVQNVMHVVIGAPEPTPEASTSSAAAKPRTTKRSPASRPVSTSAGHSTSTKAGALQRNAAVGLCRTWERERERLVPEARSTAFVQLAVAAGGSAKVNPYCLTVGVPLAPLTATTAGPGATASPTSAVPTTKPETAQPTTVGPTTATPTKPATTTPAPTTAPPPTTTTPAPTTAPPPTTTTADSGSGGSGSGGSGGDGSGAGAGGAAPQRGGADSAGSANRSTNAPAAGKGQVKATE